MIFVIISICKSSIFIVICFTFGLSLFSFISHLFELQEGAEYKKVLKEPHPIMHCSFSLSCGEVGYGQFRTYSHGSCFSRRKIQPICGADIVENDETMVKRRISAHACTIATSAALSDMLANQKKQH